MADALDVETFVREALEALGTQPTRDEKTGQFIAGTLAAGKTLERSEVFWSAVADAKRELLESVRRDAPDSDAPETLRGLQEAYSEARLFRSAMFVRLVEQGGPITGKGKMRALYTAYLGALDREVTRASWSGVSRTARLASAPAGVYYVPCDPTPELPLHVMDPRTGRDERLGTLEGVGDRPLGLSVAPDGNAIVYRREVLSRADLMLIENFR